MLVEFAFPGMRRYVHDCNKCIYLGEYRQPPEGDSSSITVYYDLYFCQGPKIKGVRSGGSVLARYGSEGSYYTSNIHTIWTTVSPLVEARSRAVAWGIISSFPTL